MLHITETAVKDAITVKSCLPIIRHAYLECNEDGISTGPRLVMAATESGDQGQLFRLQVLLQLFGKPQQRPASHDLDHHFYSDQTGQLEAVVEANALTAIKTAGSAAVATELLSRTDSSCLAIIGSGVQAFDQVLAICAIRDIGEVSVYDLDPARAEKFIGFLKEVDGFSVESKVAPSAEAAVSEADIVCTCTTSRKPVFKGSALRPGTHVNAIGSYTPEMQEIDFDTVTRASCIFTEHVDGLWAAAGDILQPFDKGLIEKGKVKGLVGDLLSVSVSGRESQDEITLYESVGSAVLDLALAVEAFRSVSNATRSNI